MIFHPRSWHDMAPSTADNVGVVDGDKEGSVLEAIVGLKEGDVVGDWVGEIVGDSVLGLVVGTAVGVAVGDGVEGLTVGERDGLDVGDTDLHSAARA